MWSGTRDEEGYATGPGTLTFYRENWKLTTGSSIPHGKPILVNTFTGTMVKGKFDGMVSLATPDGYYSHVKYADGAPTGKWTAGPAFEGKSKKALADKAAASENEDKPRPESPAEGLSSVASSQSAKPAEDNGVEIVRAKNDTSSESLRSLTGPPSSLPKTDTKLSRAEAIRNADEQAIAAGLRVGDYRDRKVSYDASLARWSVSYEQAGTNDTNDSNHPKHFTVTVEDQTGQATLVRGN